MSNRNEDGTVDCVQCQGTGTVPYQGPDDLVRKFVKCSRCQGIGYFNKEKADAMTGDQKPAGQDGLLRCPVEDIITQPNGYSPGKLWIVGRKCPNRKPCARCAELEQELEVKDRLLGDALKVEVAVREDYEELLQENKRLRGINQHGIYQNCDKHKGFVSIGKSGFCPACVAEQELAVQKRAVAVLSRYVDMRPNCPKMTEDECQAKGSCGSCLKEYATVQARVQLSREGVKDNGSLDGEGT